MAVATRKVLIEKLTPAQEALIPRVREEWLGIGLSTAPADRERALRGVHLAYRAAGLEPPRIVVWLASPLAGAIGVAYLTELLKHLGQVRDGSQVRDQVWGQVRGQVRDQVGGQVRDQVGDQVGGQVRDQVWGQVGDQVWGQVGDQVGGQVRDQVRGQVWGQVRGQVRDQVGGQVRDQVRDQVGGQVWGQVWGQVGDQVRDQVGDQVRGQVRDQVGDQVGALAGYSLWGQHDAGWLSFYDYFRRAAPEIVGPERLEGLSEVARSAGWWWALQGAVVLTDRPEQLSRDAEGRLHSTDTAAIQYRDGFALHAVHGVRVPADVIEQPRSITAERISKEPNQEVRRVLLELFGMDRFLAEGNFKQLHKDDWGALLQETCTDTEEPLTVVRVVNSTQEPDGSFREYVLTVHPEIRPLYGDGRRPGAPQKPTALNAIASTFGLTGEEYRHLAAQT